MADYIESDSESDYDTSEQDSESEDDERQEELRGRQIAGRWLNWNLVDKLWVPSQHL